MILHNLTLHQAAVLATNVLRGLTVLFLYLCWTTLRKIVRIIQSR